MTVTRNFPRAKPYRSASEVKAIVRFRDGYRCTICGMTAHQHVEKYKKTLDVHRIVPGSRYTVRGCVTLCRPCHGPQPRRHRGPNRRMTSVFNLPSELASKFQAYVDSIRPKTSITSVIELLIEQCLEAAASDSTDD